MSHQPYESWILEDPPVSGSRKVELENHLKICPECTALQVSWEQARSHLAGAAVKPAPPYFTRRWKANLALRQREQEKKQARTLFLSIASGSAALLVAIAILQLPKFSLISFIAGFLTTLIQLSSGIENFWTITFQVFKTVQPSILIVTGILFSSWIILACLAWGISIWKFAYKKGLKK